MLQFARNHKGIFDYFPAEDREIKKLPRAYISNVLYTTIGNPFKNWVYEEMEARNNAIADKNDLMVDLDPDIASIFQNSNSISGKLHVSQEVHFEILM
jgi:hypothetical protein